MQRRSFLVFASMAAASCTGCTKYEILPFQSASVHASMLGSFPVHARPLQQSIDAGGNVWIASYVDHTVIQMSPAGTVLQSFTMALPPDCAVVDADGNVWLCNQSDESVTKITATGTVIGTYPTGKGPDAMAFDRRGYAWISNSGDPTVTVLNASGALVGTYSTGSGAPWNVAIDKNGNAWTDNFASSDVSEISASGALLGVFRVGNEPQVLGVDPAGYIWVPNGGGVTRLDPQDGRTHCNVSLRSYITGLGVGGLAVDGDGNAWAYGANPDLTVNGVFEISPECTVLAYFAYGDHAAYASIDSSGNLWLTNNGNATIMKIATGNQGRPTPMVLAIP